MELFLALIFFTLLLGAGYVLARKRKLPTEQPPEGHTPKPPDNYDGSKGWFGRK